MAKHSAKKSNSESPGFFSQFARLLSPQRLEEACDYKKTKRGRPPSVLVSELVIGLVFHVMSGPGKFGEHLGILTGKRMSEGSLAERRSSLPWKVFERVLDWGLQPVAERKKHPDAFYKGLRLIGVDGTRFSLSNTPAVLKNCTKAVSRRLNAAFAKMDLVVLLEIGTHNPIAAAIGRDHTKKKGSEWELALRLLHKLPAESLLIADRLYGCGRFLWEIGQRCQAQSSHFLIRVRSSNKPKLIEELKDGSRLVEAKVKDKKRRLLGTVCMREIYARIERKGRKPVVIRLWTSLLDPDLYPALELVELYAKRWEHEVYYRELKIEMRGGSLLHSHTPETAAQEIAALVLATALIARRRIDAANGSDLPVLRISFAKTVRLLEPLWITFQLGDDILSDSQKRELLERFYEQLIRMATGKPRTRSYPRKLRQPVSNWPRKLENEHHEGAISYEIISSVL